MIRWIRGRSKWTSYRPRFTNRRLPVAEFYVHHTVSGSAKGWSAKKEREAMRNLEAFHRNSNGWTAIGYSFVIFPSGRIYEGRGWAPIGAHTEGRNEEAVGVACYGNYETEKPTDKMIGSIVWLGRKGRKTGKLARSPKIDGHRNALGAATACPGRHLMAALPKIKGGITAR